MAKDYLISGIQQIGIGVPELEPAWLWYRQKFGMDVPIFREAAEAALMTAYTGGTPQSRDAVLAVNLCGGSGFEVWQFTSRKTAFPEKQPVLGDTGIFAAILKSPNVPAALQFLKDAGCSNMGDLQTSPDGTPVFSLRDPWGNHFQIKQSQDWFQKNGHPVGGPFAALIGVSDVEAALKLYSHGLGFDIVDYDETGTFPDWKDFPGGNNRFRRLMLSRSEAPSGPFSPLFGPCHIELVQALDRCPDKIFKGRYWGDAGFIHLCFDVQGMDALKESLSDYPFTVDSGTSFDMGEAAGRFAYIEDGDGTLIEFVETLKIPIIKKIGWYLNLSNRPLGKPLPSIILKALGLARVH